jgi:Flp pilus assembly protein protease CpaA
MLPTVAASNAAFFTLFAIFVAGMLVLIFLTLRFVIRRDRAGRKAWLERQVERQSQAQNQSPQGGAPPAPRP